MVGRPVQPSSCTLWKTIPACSMPAGTCIRAIHSSSQRASSRMSGTPLSPSGIDSAPSSSRATLPAARRDLPRVEQLVHGDAAVHHVLAVVAGVVPAAVHVERLVAGPALVVVLRRLAADGEVAAVGRVAQVAGGARIILPRVAFLQLDAAAGQREIVQRVGGEGGVEAVADRERVARLAVGLQGEAFAGLR